MCLGPRDLIAGRALYGKLGHRRLDRLRAITRAIAAVLPRKKDAEAEIAMMDQTTPRLPPCCKAPPLEALWDHGTGGQDGKTCLLESMEGLIARSVGGTEA
jgi:hypothetical protein